MSFEGPIDRFLALLEASLGRTEDACRSMDAAELLCQRLDARLHLALIERDRNKLDGHDSPHTTRATLPHGGPELALRRRGELWVLDGADSELSFKNTKGMGMLARLLDEPDRELHVLDLSGSTNAPTQNGIPRLDAKARAAYRLRAESLRGEIAEAEGWNDTARAEKARAELEVLSQELASAVGLGGRDRETHSTVERARVNVQRRIKDAIRRIAEQDEAVGRHLARSVRTGTYCAYEPD
jgi:non-specific serine/threonine protein kinase